MRNPSTQFRIYFLMGVVFLGMGAIFAKLWYVQIARGAEYTARLKSAWGDFGSQRDSFGTESCEL